MIASGTRQWLAVALSAAGHLALGLTVSTLRSEPNPPAEPESVEIAVILENAPPPEPVEPPLEEPGSVEEPVELPPEPVVEPPPAPEPPPPEAEPPPPPPRPRTPVPEAVASAEPAAEPPPSFGLRLEGGGAPGGVAVPFGDTLEAPRPEEPVREMRRTTRREPEPATEAAPSRERSRERATSASACDDEPTRPRPTRTPQPVYPEEARAAGVEGRVRVRVQVNREGEPVDVEIIEGLGHGLDEAAIEAVRRWRFSPSTACGEPVDSTFTARLTFRV